MALSGSKAQEATLGQYGSIFVDTTGTVTPPSGYIFCAITFLADNGFTLLTAENTTDGERMFPSTAYSAHEDGNGYEGSGGDTIASANVMPKGITLYGRWTSFAVAADSDGGVIAYLAPQ